MGFGICCLLGVVVWLFGGCLVVLVCLSCDLGWFWCGPELREFWISRRGSLGYDWRFVWLCGAGFGLRAIWGCR